VFLRYALITPTIISYHDYFYILLQYHPTYKAANCNTASAGPSGSEGDVVIGDNSSVSVIVPEDLPVGQDVELEDGEIHDPDHLQPRTNVCACVLVFNKKSLKK
jgi:hypothetical protein